MVNIAVISGGTAANSILDVFQRLVDDPRPQSRKGRISYILPISDNGGSTSEIIRVLGGCSVGDIRSRITRLIPDESAGLRDLLSHRLSQDPDQAKKEWNEIVDGSHSLWTGVDAPCRQIMRSFLLHVHMEILKRSRHSAKNFRLELASVGNLFLTGARLFCGSLDSSIELVLRMTKVPSNIQILPCINTNFTYHISALLTNGTVITGQSQISHPSLQEPSPQTPEMLVPVSPLLFTDDVVLHREYSTGTLGRIDSVKRTTPRYRPLDAVADPDPSSDVSSILTDEDVDNESPEGLSKIKSDNQSDAGSEINASYFHPDLTKSQLYFNKDDMIPLPSPIERIFYISPYGEEIYPMASTRVLHSLKHADAVVYSIGSLMTSIIPVLILQGVGEAIVAGAKTKKKILLLNGSADRETHGMSALDCILFIAQGLNYSRTFHPAGKKKGIQFNAEVQPLAVSDFISHVFYLESSSEISVDAKAIEALGVKCVAVKTVPGAADRYDLGDMYGLLSALIRPTCNL